AAMFGIRPLHVESVAWIAERKDVLSAFFFMLTLGAYARYARKPSALRYGTMSIFLTFGLMSKPMLVTVPIILLLLDYWPLGRWQTSTVTKLIVEKVPLLLLSAAVSVATFFAQTKAVWGFKYLPFWWRLTNAMTAYIIYIWEMVWPSKLALIYPHLGRLPLWQG